MPKLFRPSLYSGLSFSLLLLACTQTSNPTIINNNQNTVLLGSNGITDPESPFAVLGGAGLDPTVFKVCTGGESDGDQGYARSTARQYRQYLEKLLGRTSGGNSSSTGSIYGADLPANDVNPEPSIQPTPFASATSDISVVEKTTVQGDLYDNLGKPVGEGLINIRSLNSGVEFTASTGIVGGTYSFNQVPAGVQLEIEVQIPGYATRRRVVVAKSNKQGDPDANKYDFGSLDNEGEPDLRTALSALPEVVAVFPTRNATKVPVNTDFMLRFSKPMSTESVETNFGVWAASTVLLPGDAAPGLAAKKLLQDLGPNNIQAATFYGVGADGKDKDALGDFQKIPYQSSPSGGWLGKTTEIFGPEDFNFSWRDNQTELRANLKPGLRLPSAEGVAPDYLVGLFHLDGQISDLDGSRRTQDYFKLTEGYHEEYFKFSVAAGDEPFNFEQFSTLMLGLRIQDQHYEPLPPPTKVRDDYYFSYDDSASVASVELFKDALEAGAVPDSDWAKTWEFLNYESFDHLEQQSVGLFDVSMGLWKHADLNNSALDQYEVGVHVSAPYLCMATRKLLNLTILIDVSTSMDEEAPRSGLEGGKKPSKLELVRYGMEQMGHQLKVGDTVSLVLFSGKAFTTLENFEIGKGTDQDWDKALSEIETLGGTNLQAGVEEAYRVAQKTLDPQRMNRVLLMTDAQTNEGNLDLNMLKNMAARGDQQGVYLSALGIGHHHNQALLNQITEAGRGAYYTVANKTDMKEAMGDRFIPLIDVMARNVRFNLEFPGWMRHGKSAAEQVSSNPEEVQPTNFSANTSQYFWEQFQANKGDYTGQDSVKLTITYQDPNTGQTFEKVIEKPLAEMLDRDLGNIKAAHMVQLTTALVRNEMTAAQVRAELDGLLPEIGT